MAKDRNFDMITSISDSAGLKDQRGEDKKVATLKGDGTKQKKQIEIDVSWINSIKDYYGGAVTSYIIMAVREKMQRDKIL